MREYTLQDTIRATLKARGMTQTDLARRMGITISKLSRVLSGGGQMTTDVLAEIGGALDMRIATGPNGWEFHPIGVVQRPKTVEPSRWIIGHDTANPERIHIIHNHSPRWQAEVVPASEAFGDVVVRAGDVALVRVVWHDPIVSPELADSLFQAALAELEHYIWQKDQSESPRNTDDTDACDTPRESRNPPKRETLTV